MCSALVDSDANQCPICLTRFKDAKSKKKKRDVGLCTQCGAFLLNERDKCPVCGHTEKKVIEKAEKKPDKKEEERVPSIHLCPNCKALIKMGVEQCPICSAYLNRETIISISSTSLDDEISPTSAATSASMRGSDEFFRAKAEVTKTFEPDKAMQIKDVEDLRFEEYDFSITDDVVFMDRILTFSAMIAGIILLFITISFAFPQMSNSRIGGFLILSAIPIILFTTLLTLIKFSASIFKKILILVGIYAMVISHLYFSMNYVTLSSNPTAYIAIIVQVAAGIIITLLGIARLSKRDEKLFSLWALAFICISHGIAQAIIRSPHWYMAQGFTAVGILVAYYVIKDHFDKKFIATLPVPGAISKETAPLVFEGIAMLLSGDPSKAITDLSNEIAFDPDNEMLWNTKGYALTRIGRYQEAVKCYERAIAINPNYAEAWNNKGNALTRQRKYDEALWCYDRALEIDHDYREVWHNKRYVYMKMGRRSDALKCEKRAVEYY